MRTQPAKRRFPSSFSHAAAHMWEFDGLEEINALSEPHAADGTGTRVRCLGHKFGQTFGWVVTHPLFPFFRSAATYASSVHAFSGSSLRGTFVVKRSAIAAGGGDASAAEGEELQLCLQLRGVETVTAELAASLESYREERVLLLVEQHHQRLLRRQRGGGRARRHNHHADQVWFVAVGCVVPSACCPGFPPHFVSFPP